MVSQKVYDNVESVSTLKKNIWMTKTFEFKKTNNRILTTNYRESKKVACLDRSIIKTS